MRGISKNQYNQVLHIDESGNLFGDDRYFIISAVRFSSVFSYNKWVNIAKEISRSNYDVRQEIKSAEMEYKLKRKLLHIVDRKVDFDIWMSVIDTHHQHYQEYIRLNRNSAFSNVVKVLVEKYITTNNTISRVYIDKRLRSEARYSLIRNGVDVVEYN